jgi:hypothetical protein
LALTAGASCVLYIEKKATATGWRSLCSSRNSIISAYRLERMKWRGWKIRQHSKSRRLATAQDVSESGAEMEAPRVCASRHSIAYLKVLVIADDGPGRAVVVLRP